MIARMVRYPVRSGQELAFEQWLQREVLPRVGEIPGCQAFYVMREFGERALSASQVFDNETALDTYKASSLYRAWIERIRQRFLDPDVLVEERLYQVLDQQHGFFPGPGLSHAASASAP